MKKFLLAAGIMFAANAASAQISIAPEIGAQMSNLSMKGDTSGGASFSSKFTYRAGVNVAIPISKKFNVHAGAFYTARGAKADFSLLGFTASAKTSLSYIDVPVYINYNIVTFSGHTLFAGVGPYASYCIKAKQSTAVTGGGIDEKDESDLKIGSDAASDDIKALDFGANANVGLVTKWGVYARVNYSMGLANLVPGGDSDNYIKNKSFGVSLGYQITF